MICSIVLKLSKNLSSPTPCCLYQCRYAFAFNFALALYNTELIGSAICVRFDIRVTELVVFFESARDFT